MDLEQLKQRIIDGEKAGAVALTQQAIDAGRSPADIFTQALFPAMDRVGWLVHVMVGGAPVNATFAQEIGADFHSNHAATASSYAREYMEARSA